MLFVTSDVDAKVVIMMLRYQTINNTLQFGNLTWAVK